jgi:hypothetical protein
MTGSTWVNAAARSLVWLGATAWLAYLKKPDLWSNLTLARGERREVPLVYVASGTGDGSGPAFELRSGGTAVGFELDFMPVE